MPMVVRDCPQIIPEIGPQHTLETMSEQLAVDGGNPRAPAWRPGGRTGLERGLDGGGAQQRGLGVDGDVPAEQYAADDLPGVAGRVLRVGALIGCGEVCGRKGDA
jgi:hypothetical protein